MGAEVAAVLQELKEARKQDNELRRKELDILLEATRKKDPVKVASIFQVKPQATLPKMGDKDHDVESHMEEFEDLCNLANPSDNVAPAERLRLLGSTLEGAKLRTYKAFIKEAKRDGTNLSEPQKVFDRIVAQLYVDFHETQESKAMRAKRQYDSLEKGKESYQTFSIGWSESLTDLRSAGIDKGASDL